MHTTLSLETRLEGLAARARRTAHRLFFYARRATTLGMAKHDWHQHSLVAAYLAFIELGGAPDVPDQFDWKHPRLLPLTLKHLRVATIGGASDFIDVHQRNQSRKSGACNDAVCWDAWRAGVESVAKVRSATKKPAPITGEYYANDGFERVPNEYSGESLLWALAKVLKPQEVVWLVRRYRDGVHQDVLARELCAKDARYQDPTGYDRAINYINVTIHRAKKRARSALGTKWEALAMEAA